MQIFLVLLQSVTDISTISKLIAELGLPIVISAVFILLAIYLFKFLTKTITEKFDTFTTKMDELINRIDNKNMNNIDYQSSMNVLKNSLYPLRYSLISEIMRVYSQNDIKNPVRQTIIHENLTSLINNELELIRINLSRFKYETNTLSCYIKISDNFLDNILNLLFADQNDTTKARLDVLRYIESSIISETNKIMESVK